MNKSLKNIWTTGRSAIFLSVICLVLFAPSRVNAAARIASVTGNWNATATWGGAAVLIM
ncbi:MAG: hypothetical protein WCL16_08680 [bacterium]